MTDLQITQENTVVQRVSKLAGPALAGIVKQKIGSKIASIVAKSIPVVGTVVALKGAYDKLKSIWNSGQSIASGDIIGAGLDVASTFGSFITTIPATAYNMARELYAEAFAGPKGEVITLEQDLVADPQGTKQRLNSLVGNITNTIKQEIDIAMTKVKNTPTAPQAVAQAPTAPLTPSSKPPVAETVQDLDRIKQLAGLVV